MAKPAFAADVDLRTEVDFRTLLAALTLWMSVLLFAIRLNSISKPAVASSLLSGGINGVGSLFFYGNLPRVDASLGKVTNISDLIFVTLLMRLGGIEFPC